MQLQPTPDSPDTQRTRLKGHGMHKSVYGKPTASIVAGAIFVPIGAAIGLVGLGVIPVDPKSIHGPRGALVSNPFPRVH